MRNNCIGALCGAAMIALGGAFPASAAPESSDPIKIAVNEWTGQHISAHIAGELLKKAGYNVEYVTAGAVPQFAAIAQGNIHAQPEVWTNNVGAVYPKAVESGDIEVLGQLGLAPRESWIYPPYMEEKCPGLPSYEALYKCAQAFASAETFPKGRLITYPADWGTRSKELVAAIDMPLAPVAGGSEGAMIAELRSAYAAKEPVLMMFWAPHWLHAELEFNWVEWPAYQDGCDTDPKLGINPKEVNDCGFQQATIDKIVWKGVKDKWPGAYRFFQAISLSNADQNRMMLEIDNKGRDLDTVVGEWIDANEAKWKPWVETAAGS